MNSDLKKKIINQPQLYKMFVYVGNLRYYFSNKTYLKGRNNVVKFYKGVLRKNVKIKIIGDNNSIIINDNCRLKNTTITIFGSNNNLKLEEKVMVYENSVFNIEGSNTYIKIGKHTTIGSASLVIGEGNTGILIGEDCMLSRDIVMNTSDYHSIISLSDNKRINPPKNIKIVNHVWIGHNAYISKGAVIGNNCVVAAHAYVGNKFFDDNIILGGIPAKQIKDNINWTREILP
jgi:acetyltransferase-like isoleucine patch superfamily enzyme